MSTNTLDHIAIKNTLSRYCVALDSKDFDLLGRVFTPNATADYPFNSDLNGVGAIQDAIRNRLGPVRTHHNLTTQTITFHPNGTSATAVTYFIGVHFGQGPHEGKMLQAYGRYEDELVYTHGKLGEDEGVPGASGLWRIKNRKVAFTQRIGDEKIMKEF